MRRLILATLVSALAACTQPQAPAPTSDATPPPATSTPPANAQDSTPASDLPPADSTPAPAPDEPEARGLAQWGGYGDTRFGMDEAAFTRAWGGELKNLKEDPACFHLMPKSAKTSAALAFMFVDGKFARYSTESAKEVAPGGGKVGASMADIESMYGKNIDVQPHKYTDGKYLRIKHGDDVLIFATDKAGVVQDWRVGRPPAIDYVEGCA